MDSPRVYFTAIRLIFCFLLRISGDSRPAILGIARFAVRDSVLLRAIFFGVFGTEGCLWVGVACTPNGSYGNTAF